MEARTGATLTRFGNARFAADRDALTAILDRPDRIPGVARRGLHLHNIWVDAANPRGLWRRTTLASYRSEQPAWETILDLDALAAREGEDWVWRGGSMLRGTHDRAILSLSRGGSDAVVLREFDLVAKAFVEGGFSLPEAKGAQPGSIGTPCCWRAPSAAAWPPPPATPAPYVCGGGAPTSRRRPCCSR